MKVVRTVCVERQRAEDFEICAFSFTLKVLFFQIQIEFRCGLMLQPVTTEANIVEPVWKEICHQVGGNLISWQLQTYIFHGNEYRENIKRKNIFFRPLPERGGDVTHAIVIIRLIIVIINTFFLSQHKTLFFTSKK